MSTILKKRRLGRHQACARCSRRKQSCSGTRPCTRCTNTKDGGIISACDCPMTGPKPSSHHSHPHGSSPVHADGHRFESFASPADSRLASRKMGSQRVRRASRKARDAVRASLLLEQQEAEEAEEYGLRPASSSGAAGVGVGVGVTGGVTGGAVAAHSRRRRRNRSGFDDDDEDFSVGDVDDDDDDDDDYTDASSPRSAPVHRHRPRPHAPVVAHQPPALPPAQVTTPIVRHQLSAARDGAMGLKVSINRFAEQMFGTDRSTVLDLVRNQQLPRWVDPRVANHRNLWLQQSLTQPVHSLESVFSFSGQYLRHVALIPGCPADNCLLVPFTATEVMTVVRHPSSDGQSPGTVDYVVSTFHDVKFGTDSLSDEVATEVRALPVTTFLPENLLTAVPKPSPVQEPLNLPILLPKSAETPLPAAPAAPAAVVVSSPKCKRPSTPSSSTDGHSHGSGSVATLPLSPGVEASPSGSTNSATTVGTTKTTTNTNTNHTYTHNHLDTSATPTDIGAGRPVHTAEPPCFSSAPPTFGDRPLGGALDALLSSGLDDVFDNTTDPFQDVFDDLFVPDSTTTTSAPVLASCGGSAATLDLPPIMDPALVL